MNILAFDQSSTHVGWCIFKYDKLALWDEFIPDPPHFDALREFVKNTIKEHAIDTVLVESIFFGKNVQAFKVLATVRAHIWASSRDAKCEVIEVTAYAAMKALTGITDIHTKSKDRKAAMIKSASELTNSKVGEHSSDAIGILAAYLQSLGLPLSLPPQP